MRADRTTRRQLMPKLLTTLIVSDEDVRGVKTEVLEAVTALDLIPALGDEVEALTMVEHARVTGAPIANNPLSTEVGAGTWS